MRRILQLVALIGIGVAQAQAAPAQLKGVRMWTAPDRTRVVLDVSAPVEHKIFTIHGPERVVIDLNGARLGTSAREMPQKNGLVKRMRTGRQDGGDLRLVLDLERAVRPKSFLLTPNASYGHRLVVDLYDSKARKSAAPPAHSVSAPGKPRELVIAIDAGHGGEDPGARGPRGTREKTVVLGIARKLAALVEQESGMRPVLIRDGDYYIGLRNRARKARKHQADLFISIHADAFRDRRVHGSSVYVVSRRGASNEMARWLAERENAADLAGGVSLDDKDDLLKTVLLDLSQSASIEASLGVGGSVLHQLGKLGKVHKSRVQQAGFMVLKSPDIPSILVETAFISNPAEERRLRSPAHQRRVARAIFDGVREYFSRKPPAGTVFAARRHVIKKGETLSGIARRYEVSVKNLRVANGLSDNRVRAGDVLRIPPPAVGG